MEGLRWFICAINIVNGPKDREDVYCLDLFLKLKLEIFDYLKNNKFI